MNQPANIINHFGLVLDASSSMTPFIESLIQVADNQIKYLARRSQELEQETRISVWVFSNHSRISCVVWDMDVLRLPSIREFYRPNGQTAFIDATLKAMDDLAEIPERYGNHSFLVYVLTDGEENDSINRSTTLQKRIDALPDHWTLAALVPNANGKHEAKRFGFPAGNIEVWDATSQAGVSEAGERIRTSMDAYMTGRASGVRATRSLFGTGADVVNASTIRAAGLTPLARNSYILVPVPKDVPIKDFTEDCGQRYMVSRGFYELSKRETIQAGKSIAIVERRGKNNVYVGDEARKMLGLPDMEVRVGPDYNADYAVFVQSTSVNRKLIAGTRYLYLI